MKKILLMSDNHGYEGEELLRHAHWADEIWHAGDWLNKGLFDQLEHLGKPLRTVWGNADGHELRACMPEEAWFQVEGVKVFMTHIGGYPGKYPARILAKLKMHPPDLFICGHSHILKVIRDEKLGLLHLNPGACGLSGFHKQRTMLRFVLESGKIKNVELIDLGGRSTL